LYSAFSFFNEIDIWFLKSDKNMTSFLRNRLFLGSISNKKNETEKNYVSFLHKLETKYAWGRFHFYTSLKQRKTMLGVSISFLHELETKSETVLE
jgi:hypothetical protein